MSDTRDSDRVTFNGDGKFDFQLNRALVDEHRLARLLLDGKFEHKCERHQPWDFGNICIETAWNGRPSGIMTTEASVWAQELKHRDETIMTMLFPVPVLRRLTRYFENDPVCNNRFRGGGDGGLSDGVKLPIGPLRHWGRIVQEMEMLEFAREVLK
jgi:hypothetical protein